jgi:hypothetical protein
MMIPKKYTLTATAGVVVLTPYVMACNSHHLFAMAHAYDMGAEVPLSRYFLYCASIEIGLKAAILARDCSTDGKKRIKAMGHDLLKVNANFEAEYSVALLDAETDQWVLGQINPFFVRKGLEYFTGELLGIARSAFGALPSLTKLGQIAEKVNGFLRGQEYFLNVEPVSDPAIDAVVAIA